MTMATNNHHLYLETDAQVAQELMSPVSDSSLFLFFRGGVLSCVSKSQSAEEKSEFTQRSIYSPSRKYAMFSSLFFLFFLLFFSSFPDAKNV